MPTVMRHGAYRFFFFSNERNKPAHIHVQADDGYAKFWLNPVTLADSSGISAPQITELRRLVEKNKALFTEKWNEHFHRKS